MKLLLDENVSPKVALELRADCVDICHVRDRGLLAATDAKVLECAFAEDRVLVTANVCDFVALTRARELHAGVILLEDGSLSRDKQIKLLRAVVVACRKVGDLTNKLVWVGITGAVRVEDCP